MALPRIICFSVLVETSPQALPLGAACIASAIKSSPLTASRFSVELHDISVEDADYQKVVAAEGDTGAVSLIAARLTAADQAGNIPAVVCFSVYVWNHAILAKTAAALHERLPGIICIAGGPEATAAPHAFSSFDYVVAGQGENAVPQVIAQLFSARDADARTVLIPGVYAGNASDDHAPVVRAVPCPTENLCSPYLDGTLDPARYGGALWELARGCPFQCSYCYESKGEKRIQYFPQSRLERELELFARKKIPQVFVLDPTYNADKKRAVSIIKQIAQKAPGMFFYFEARAEFIDRELAQAFASIPCCLQIGLQSADTSVLARVHRTLDTKIFSRNIGYLNESGAIFGFDLIYGLPGDTLTGFTSSIDFALSLYPNNLELFCLSVLPGTVLHDEASALGLSWDHEPPYHVCSSSFFPASDLARAASLARAVQLFYTKGRAVPWFMAVVHSLHKKPADFLSDFARYMETTHEDCSAYETAQVVEMQLAFIRSEFTARHLERLLPAAEDCIVLNGALGECTATGAASSVILHYHPDDIMSPYTADLSFFVKNARPHSCRVRVAAGKNGADWRVEK